MTKEEYDSYTVKVKVSKLEIGDLFLEKCDGSPSDYGYLHRIKSINYPKKRVLGIVVDMFKGNSKVLLKEYTMDDEHNHYRKRKKSFTKKQIREAKAIYESIEKII